MLKRSRYRIKKTIAKYEGDQVQDHRHTYTF